VIESPMFIVTPELAKRSQEYSDNLKAEKKRLPAQYLLERDEKLKAMGLENCDQFYVEKIVEVEVLASKVEEEAMKGAKEALKETLGTSEADASGSVPKVVVSETVISEAAISEAVISEAAASDTAVSEATQSAKVDQIPDPKLLPHLHHQQTLI